MYSLKRSFISPRILITDKSIDLLVSIPCKLILRSCSSLINSLNSSVLVKEFPKLISFCSDLQSSSSSIIVARLVVMYVSILMIFDAFLIRIGSSLKISKSLISYYDALRLELWYCAMNSSTNPISVTILSFVIPRQYLPIFSKDNQLSGYYSKFSKC